MNTTNYEDEVSTGWIENLALEEINMDESGIVHINDHLDPSAFLDESSIEFMDRIREKFEAFVAKFNEFRGGPHQNSQIKIFKISNTVNDFMLFRNSLRLIISRKARDLISISFSFQGKEYFSNRLNREDPASYNTEIRAAIGPFNNIIWKFKGEPFDLDSMSRHFLTEFIRNSAR